LSQLDSYVTEHDLSGLYLAFAERLEQIVRDDLRVPDPVIEDACQFAWSRLAHHVGRVRLDKALSWLAQTAVHEAMKLWRRDRRELSLELAAEETPELIEVATCPGADEVYEQRERLASLRALPERQQRMMWLQGLGLSYVDIATSTGCTTRTVERQLHRAKRQLRSQDVPKHPNSLQLRAVGDR
jgi:RNA polymerase sigma factor (sigma-70 family)